MGEMGILFRIRRAAILFRSLSNTVVVEDEGLQQTCSRSCAARERINRIGRIRKNVQGMESAFYRTLNAKTP